MTERTFERFSEEVEGLLSGTAKGKGYSGEGPNGVNRLYEFVQEMNGGHAHALGECVYKVRRYAAKGNPEDILKAAAWCYLIYRHHEDDDTRTT